MLIFNWIKVLFLHLIKEPHPHWKKSYLPSNIRSSVRDFWRVQWMKYWGEVSDFCFVLTLFQLFVTLCRNHSINKHNIWLFLTEKEAQRTVCPPSTPFLYHTHIMLYASKYSMFPEHDLQFHTSMPMFMWLPLPGMSSFFSSKFYSCRKAKMALVSVKLSKGFPPLTCVEGEHDLVTFCLCIYYAWIFYCGISVCLPLNPAPWGQKLGLLYLYTPVLSSGITLRRGVFSHPTTGVWAVWAFDIKGEKWSDVS